MHSKGVCAGEPRTLLSKTYKDKPLEPDFNEKYDKKFNEVYEKGIKGY